MQIVEEKRAEYADWKAKNDDPYGAECFRYAEAWAELMEGEIVAGAKLEDIAKRTSHVADTAGLTGFMYGMAVSILSKMWVHGEALRRWHNLDIQIGNEGARANESGGVLNPAIVGFEAKDA